MAIHLNDSFLPLIGQGCSAHHGSSNSLLGGSENHAPSVPPFREPHCGIGLNNRKTIAVQCSLAEATQG
jgi:hypothetical protein